MDVIDARAFRAVFGSNDAEFDSDGDADCDMTDARGFNGAFGRTGSSANDFDGDGDVDALDFGAYRARLAAGV